MLKYFNNFSILIKFINNIYRHYTTIVIFYLLLLMINLFYGFITQFGKNITHSFIFFSIFIEITPVSVFLFYACTKLFEYSNNFIDLGKWNFMANKVIKRKFK